MGEGKSAIRYVVLFFSMSGIVFCTFLSFLFISKESTLMLLVFDLFFASLMLLLKGTLLTKTCLLLIGNGVGLLWNYLFFQFVYVGAYYLGSFFNTLYLILNPFMNLAWIVSFWSVSLTILAGSQKRKPEGSRVDS